MNRLFIELYFDEDVDVLIAELIRAHGFSVLTTLEANNLRSSDEAQLKFATTQGRIFLTHNRVHFELLAQQYFESGKEHDGIIIAVRRSPYEIMRRLLIILNYVTADEMKNKLRYI